MRRHDMRPKIHHDLLASLTMESWVLPYAIIAVSIIFHPQLTTEASLDSDMRASSRLCVATRLHLGYKATPSTTAELEAKLAQFLQFCTDSCQAEIGVIAVDASNPRDDYNLLAAVQAACTVVVSRLSEQQRTGDALTPLHVLPVTPWGKFAPALNAITSFACCYKNTQQQQADKVPYLDQVLFVSAETSASGADIRHLRNQMTPDTVVAGAVLPGHDYQPATTMPLTGRTSPWNTLAIWDLRKISLTGFPLVSEGLLTPNQEAAGVEEVAATAILQKLLGGHAAKSKLVALPGVQWQEDFDGDPERQAWHARKMNSKKLRAARQLELLGIQSSDNHVVHHC